MQSDGSIVFMIAEQLWNLRMKDIESQDIGKSAMLVPPLPFSSNFYLTMDPRPLIKKWCEAEFRRNITSQLARCALRQLF